MCATLVVATMAAAIIAVGIMAVRIIILEQQWLLVSRSGCLGRLRHHTMSRPTITGRPHTTRHTATTVTLPIGLWCKLSQPTQRSALDHYAAYAARTAFQISGAVLPLMRSFPSLN